MSRKRKTIYVALGYFLSIIVFSFIYDVLYHFNTSSFIINEDYNQITAPPMFDFREIPQSINVQENLSTKQVNDSLKVKLDSLKLCKDSIAFIDRTLKINAKRDSMLSHKLWLTHNQNLDSLIENKSRLFLEKKRGLLDSIQSLTKQQSSAGKNIEREGKLAVQISKKRVALAENEINLAQIRADMLEDGLKHIEKYSDPKLTKKMMSYSNERIRLEDANYKIQNVILYLQRNILDLSNAYHAIRLDKVGLGDFFYFSVITATSTGYGDILPNNLLVRALVSLEVLINLVLFGFFFYYIAEKES